jgi:hypothetical protein
LGDNEKAARHPERAPNWRGTAKTHASSRASSRNSSREPSPMREKRLPSKVARQPSPVRESPSQTRRSSVPKKKEKSKAIENEMKEFREKEEHVSQQTMERQRTMHYRVFSQQYTENSPDEASTVQTVHTRRSSQVDDDDPMMNLPAFPSMDLSAPNSLRISPATEAASPGLRLETSNHSNFNFSSSNNYTNMEYGSRHRALADSAKANSNSNAHSNANAHANSNANASQRENSPSPLTALSLQQLEEDIAPSQPDRSLLPPKASHTHSHQSTSQGGHRPTSSLVPSLSIQMARQRLYDMEMEEESSHSPRNNDSASPVNLGNLGESESEGAKVGEPHSLGGQSQRSGRASADELSTHNDPFRLRLSALQAQLRHLHSESLQLAKKASLAGSEGPTPQDQDGSPGYASSDSKSLGASHELEGAEETGVITLKQALRWTEAGDRILCGILQNETCREDLIPTPASQLAHKMLQDAPLALDYQLRRLTVVRAAAFGWREAFYQSKQYLLQSNEESLEQLSSVRALEEQLVEKKFEIAVLRRKAMGMDVQRSSVMIQTEQEVLEPETDSLPPPFRQTSPYPEGLETPERRMQWQEALEKKIAERYEKQLSDERAEVARWKEAFAKLLKKRTLAQRGKSESAPEEIIINPADHMGVEELEGELILLRSKLRARDLDILKIVQQKSVQSFPTSKSKRKDKEKEKE